MSQQLFALAFGIGTQNQQGQWLEVYYPQPLLNPPAELMYSQHRDAGHRRALREAGLQHDPALTQCSGLSAADGRRPRGRHPGQREPALPFHP